MIEVKDRELLQKVKDNDMKCLCTIEDTSCICDEFKKQQSGDCHCGVYTKKVVIYTTKTCTRCPIIKKKFEDKNVPYIEVQDIEEMKKLNIKTVPVVKINNELMDFRKSIEFLNKLK